jgi:hypothetical protein
MPVFDKLDAMAVRAVDRVFGEAFIISPRAAPSLDVNARTVGDGQREPIEFTASYYEYFSRVDMQSTGTPRSKIGVTVANMAQNAGHTSLRSRIKFNLSALPYRPTGGDRITRVSTGAVYRVAEVRGSSHGNVTVDLNIIERPV